MYIYLHICIHNIHTYIYIYMCACAYMYTRECIGISDSALRTPRWYAMQQCAEARYTQSANVLQSVSSRKQVGAGEALTHPSLNDPQMHTDTDSDSDTDTDTDT